MARESSVIAPNAITIAFTGATTVLFGSIPAPSYTVINDTKITAIAPASTGTQIKSPVQLVVSTYKKLGLAKTPTYPEFAALTGGLGQTIFYPPNVKGWDGGRAWINPATIFERENIIRFVSVTDMDVGRNVDEVLRVLDALQTDELCPCNWQKGEKTLEVA